MLWCRGKVWNGSPKAPTSIGLNPRWFVKTHDKDYFHKYVTADTALRILSTLKVRWSSARQFNDPFDLQVDLRFDFDRRTLGRRLLEEVDRMIFSKEEPVGDESHPVFRGIKECWRNSSRFDREAVRRQGERLASEIENEGDVIQQAIQRTFAMMLGEFKLLCVSEHHDDLLMWAHYADYHRGVVLRLRCLPEFDTALCAAMQVTYSDDLPVMARLEDWVRRLTGQPHTVTGERIFMRYCLTKSSAWSYEREWRVLTKRDYESGDGFVLLDLLPQEIEAVYLGCRVSPEARLEVARRLTGSLRHVNLYQARKSLTRFALEFDLMARGDMPITQPQPELHRPAAPPSQPAS